MDEYQFLPPHSLNQKKIKLIFVTNTGGSKGFLFLNQ